MLRPWISRGRNLGAGVAMALSCALIGNYVCADTAPATPATNGPATNSSATNSSATNSPAANSAATNNSAANTAAASQKALNTQVQDIKKQALELNRDLFALEEELLFPANTQVAVFVSLDVGQFFSLDAVQIKLDDKIVANYLYTERQVDALQRGGVQRLYVGNVKGGTHEIVAAFTGHGPHDRDYRRGATVKFDKNDQAKYIELKIVDATANYQPEFQVKEWQ